MTTSTNIPIVVLGLPKTNSVPALIVRANVIKDAMTSNATTFPSPVPPLATVVALIAGLTTAETAYKAHAGTRADRDSARTALLAALKQLHTYVQQLASASPAQADVIAQDAAMTLRKVGAHSKSDLAVKQTVTGSVHVIAKADKTARSNDWQYSVDGGKTWIDWPSSTKASTTITGLQPGLMVSYRHRPLTKLGPGNWSQPVSALVT